MSPSSLAAAALSLYGLAVWWDWRRALGPHLGAAFHGVLAALILGAAANVALSLAAPRRARQAIAAAALLALLTTAVIVYLAWFPDHRAPYAAAALGLACAAHALFTSLRALARDGVVARALDRTAVAAASLALALALVEGGLRLAGRIWPSPLTVAPFQSRLEAFRGEPGTLWSGFPLNSRGDNDDEPPPRDSGEKLVVLIGDSFCFAAVPRPLHYTAVCERHLPGVQVYNMGAPGFDMPEYRALLIQEALPLKPDLVVVAIFVGNDLFPPPPEVEIPHLLFDRSAMRTWTAASRALRVRAAPDAAGVGTLDAGEESHAEAAAKALAAPWLWDPLQEIPALEVDRFDDIERGRAAGLVHLGPALLAPFYAHVDALVADAGDVPVAFLLIPDEFQVEDAVWERVRPSAPGVARHAPQAELRPWFAARGYPLLDVLPDLLAVPPLADGRRHVYHLRETHWNTRGNQVAGKALAEFLKPLLER